MTHTRSLPFFDLLRRRRWPLLVSLMLLPLLAGCSGKGGDLADSKDPAGMKAATAGAPVDTIRISQGSDLLSLDPYFKLESPSFNIQRNVFDPLTDYDANIKIVPCLAEKWENKSPTEWVFALRQGVKFHEGQPFTADDVVFSLRRAIDWPNSRVKSEIATVDKVEKIDDFHVRIVTFIPDAILPLRLASILILNKASTEVGVKANGDDWLATHANGTGPYRVALWRKDEVCELAASDAFWGEKPTIKRMIFNPVSNDATRMAALHRGEFDIMVNVPPRYVENVKKLPGYEVIQRPSLRLIYLGLDCGRDKSPGVAGSLPNPLKDVRVRQAIAAAIDNRLIVKTIMGGNAQPADQLFPEGVTGYDPAARLERPDVAKAKTLLAAAGYPNGFAVRLDGPNDRYVNDANILQAVAGQLARVGIQVQVNATPKARFFSDEEEGACSFFLLGWANTNGDGAGTFDHLLHTLDPKRAYGESNHSTNYGNAALDQLCEAASREFDPAKREELLKQANRLAMQDLPHIPLHFQMDIYAVSKRFDWKPRRDTQVRGVDIRGAGK